MADVPIEGRSPSEVKEPVDNKEASKIKRTELKSAPQEVTKIGGFMFDPGNYQMTMVKLLQTVSLNLNYLIDMMRYLIPEADYQKFLNAQSAKEANMKALSKLQEGAQKQPPRH